MTLAADSNPKIRTWHWNPRIMLVALACAGVILALAFLSKQFPPRSPARILCALLQAVASAVVVVTSLRDIRGLDELQQRMHYEALAIAYAGTAILATGYGFLIQAGLPQIAWGSLVWPVMVVLWAVGLVIACWRYR